MRDRLRNLLRAEYLRRGLREKAMRVVRDAVHDEQATELVRVREELEFLREDIGKLTDSQAEQSQRLLDRLIEFEVRTRRDIVYASDRTVAREAAELVHERMSTVQRFDDPYRTLEYALTHVPASGMALEFGVYSGTTIKIIDSALEHQEVYGFDSFEGLPQAWRTDFDAGAFSVDTLPDVGSAELVVGWFDDTLPGFLAEHPGPVALLHIDSDLYASASTVLEAVGPRLVQGSIVVFDEYFNYPGWQHHEYRAWEEYVRKTGIEYSYLAYTYNNEQVVIRVDAVPEVTPNPVRCPGQSS